MTLTIILIVVNVVATLYAWNRTDKLYAWMLNPYAVVHRNQYHRLITSGFIHNDWMHLLFNMITLYFFGRNMEYVLKIYFGAGSGFYFLILYFVGMIVADIPSVVKHRDNPNYNSLGASGAVSAVLFASILFNPINRICIFLPVFCIPGYIFGALYLIYTYYQGKKASTHINHDAHLYGALFGIFFSVILYPRVVPEFIDKVLNTSIF